MGPLGGNLLEKHSIKNDYAHRHASLSLSGQDRDSTVVAERTVYDYFVPNFQAAIDSGVATAMEAYSGKKRRRHFLYSCYK